ncbi:hypothetical protein C8J57DRAFT_1513773 [Mycena rebaudengoi]|nr:hypothetical protein C8J57DRAFT_1513773 [Mycena rebaudengoi]
MEVEGQWQRDGLFIRPHHLGTGMSRSMRGSISVVRRRADVSGSRWHPAEAKRTYFSKAQGRGRTDHDSGASSVPVAGGANGDGHVKSPRVPSHIQRALFNLNLLRVVRAKREVGANDTVASETADNHPVACSSHALRSNERKAVTVATIVLGDEDPFSAVIPRPFLPCSGFGRPVERPASMAAHTALLGFDYAKLFEERASSVLSCAEARKRKA